MLDYCVMSQVRYTEIRALNGIHAHLMGPVPQIQSSPGKVLLGMFGTPQPLAYTRPTVVQPDFAQLPP